MVDVMLVGEPLIIFIANEEGKLAEVTDFSKGVAGAEVNVGIGLARLGHEVNYMTKLRLDDFGKFIYQTLAEENLASENIIFTESGQVGMMFKNRVSVGDPETIYYRENSVASTLSVADVEKIDFEQIKVLHMTGIPPALSESSRQACFYLMEKAKAAGCYVTFDPNLRPSLWESPKLMVDTLNQLAAFADVVLPGLAEGQQLTGFSQPEEIADFYLSLGVKTVIIKDGGQGAYFKTTNSQLEQVSGFKVTKVVDTVGAGDGFAVGVIDGYLEGLSLRETVKNANGIGAIQVQYVSDNQGLPTREELERFCLEN